MTAEQREGVVYGHTPGPWIACNNGLVRATTARTGRRIAQTHIQNIPDHHEGSEERAAINAANARLIAAAPEMLPLLASMTALARLKYGNLDAEIYAEILKAEAVIAKALGKEGEG